MRKFRINKDIAIICEWKKTRNAFKHEAVLLRSNVEVDKTKICYQNRTWEAFEFQSVLSQIAGSSELLEDEKKQVQEVAKNGSEAPDPVFNALKMFSALADLAEKDPKKRNESKARMLKAATGGAIDIPVNWSELPEEEKTRRLKGAIDTL